MWGLPTSLACARGLREEGLWGCWSPRPREWGGTRVAPVGSQSPTRPPSVLWPRNEVASGRVWEESSGCWVGHGSSVLPKTLLLRSGAASFHGARRESPRPVNEGRWLLPGTSCAARCRPQGKRVCSRQNTGTLFFNCRRTFKKIVHTRLWSADIFLIWF